LVTISYFYLYSILPLDNSHSDQELLALLREGDKEAFALIYQRYVRPLYQAANKRLQDSEQAEDLVQDVFFSLWKRRETLRINDLGPYLHTAIRYGILNHIARRKTPADFYAPLQEVLTDFNTPEDQLVAKQLMDLVYAYANTLPEKRRRVFLLHIRDKMSPAQIAQQLNITTKTAHNHLGAAMNGLRTHIAPAILILWTIL
jgi:RNA polymerase sigma-70 factor (family 1)